MEWEQDVSGKSIVHALSIKGIGWFKVKHGTIKSEFPMTVLHHMGALYVETVPGTYQNGHASYYGHGIACDSRVTFGTSGHKQYKIIGGTPGVNVAFGGGHMITVGGSDWRWIPSSDELLLYDKMHEISTPDNPLGNTEYCLPRSACFEFTQVEADGYQKITLYAYCLSQKHVSLTTSGRVNLTVMGQVDIDLLDVRASHYSYVDCNEVRTQHLNATTSGVSAIVGITAKANQVTVTDGSLVDIIDSFRPEVGF